MNFATEWPKTDGKTDGPPHNGESHDRPPSDDEYFSEQPDPGPADSADQTAEPAEELAPVDAAALCRQHLQLRPVLCESLQRFTEAANLVAPAKSHKTHLALDYSLHVATGRTWLGHFKTTAGNVLYVDCELHEETMGRRLAAIASARGILTDEFAGRLVIQHMRGQLQDIYRLGSYLRRRAPHDAFALIVLDALYRLYPPKFDENSNADMTGLYNQIDQYAKMTGAAFLIVHHQSKGVQSQKSVVDVGAGASAMSRAADAHIVLRQHEEDDCMVMEAALRSFPPLAPVAMRWIYPVWTIDRNLDPNELRETARKKTKTGEETWTAAKFISRFVVATPKTADQLVSEAEEAGLKAYKVRTWLKAAADGGHIHRWIVGDRRSPIRFSTQPAPLTGDQK